MTRKAVNKKPLWVKKQLCEILFCEMKFKVIARADWEDEGRMKTPCECGPFGTLEIGVDAGWGEVISSAVHELVELALTFQRKAYLPINQWSNQCAYRLFVFEHKHFDEATERAGDALAVVLPELAEAWREVEKRKKK